VKRWKQRLSAVVADRMRGMDGPFDRAEWGDAEMTAEQLTAALGKHEAHRTATSDINGEIVSMGCLDCNETIFHSEVQREGGSLKVLGGSHLRVLTEPPEGAAMTETEHNIEIQELGGAWQRGHALMQATCTCGWQGKRDFVPREVVEAEARRHIASGPPIRRVDD
jgi:hypothetical protein